MLGFLLVAVLGQAPVPERPAVTVRVGFSCADDPSQKLVLTPKTPVPVQVPKPCPGAGRELHLELTCSERCVATVSAEGGTIVELSGLGARNLLENEHPYELTTRVTGKTVDAIAATVHIEVFPERKPVLSALDADMWISFSWDKPRQAAIGRRIEPSEMITIDNKAGVLARVDRLEPARVRARVWCGRNESDDPVVDRELPYPEGEIFAACDGLGGLCSGRVRIEVREAF